VGNRASFASGHVMPLATWLMKLWSSMWMLEVSLASVKRKRSNDVPLGGANARIERQHLHHVRERCYLHEPV
jgi:hypothetical protein